MVSRQHPERISTADLARRAAWIVFLSEPAPSFSERSLQLHDKLRAELRDEGAIALLSHLRLCGGIPERFASGSTEEKLYAKYTDAVVCEALAWAGLDARVLEARADSADVEAEGPSGAGKPFRVVADAKAFRLTRTAKNQKDFKVGSVNRWRGDADYALVVAPADQVPRASSQVYSDAAAYGVAVLTFTHLAVIVRAVGDGRRPMTGLVEALLRLPQRMTPSKDAAAYWTAVRDVFAAHTADQHWADEAAAAREGVAALSAEANAMIDAEEAAIRSMTYEEVIEALLASRRIEGRRVTLRSSTTPIIHAV